MRRKREDVAESRNKIVRQAAKLFRERGVDNVSVADVMRAAGMTHGGFYVHFEDKNALVAAAAADAFSDIIDLLEEKPGKSKGISLGAYINGYLSMRHVSNAGLCCPIAAFAPEALHGSKASRKAIADGTRRLLAALQQKLNGRTGEAEAHELLATMIGTVVLARALDDYEINERLLRNMRKCEPVASRLGRLH